MPAKITEVKPGSYLGDVILENGIRIYLAYSNDPNLRNLVCNQIENSTSNVHNLLRKIWNIRRNVDSDKETSDLDKEKFITEKRQELFEEYKIFFKDAQQFQKTFNDFYNDQEKMRKAREVTESSKLTFNGVLKVCLPPKIFEVFTVCLSVAPLNIDSTDYPLLFSNRNIVMAMNCIMKISEPNSISVSHYGIVRDPCSLLGLTTPINNISMLLHSFAAYVSLKKYGKYLQVNAPVRTMLNIMEASGLNIYDSTEGLLSDSSVPIEINSYLQGKSISDLDNSRFAVPIKYIAIKLEDLAKEYEDKCLLLDQSKTLFFSNNQQSDLHTNYKSESEQPLFKVDIGKPAYANN